MGRVAPDDWSSVRRRAADSTSAREANSSDSRAPRSQTTSNAPPRRSTYATTCSGVEGGNERSHSRQLDDSSSWKTMRAARASERAGGGKSVMLTAIDVLRCPWFLLRRGARTASVDTAHRPRGLTSAPNRAARPRSARIAISRHVTTPSTPAAVPGRAGDAGVTTRTSGRLDGRMPSEQDGIVGCTEVFARRRLGRRTQHGDERQHG